MAAVVAEVSVLDAQALRIPAEARPATPATLPLRKLRREICLDIKVPPFIWWVKKVNFIIAGKYWDE